MEGKFKDKGVIVFEYDATETEIDSLVLMFEAGIEDVVAVVEAHDVTDAERVGE
jgi:hypothetical protein